MKKTTTSFMIVIIAAIILIFLVLKLLGQENKKITLYRNYLKSTEYLTSNKKGEIIRNLVEAVSNGKLIHKKEERLRYAAEVLANNDFNLFFVVRYIDTITAGKAFCEDGARFKDSKEVNFFYQAKGKMIKGSSRKKSLFYSIQYQDSINVVVNVSDLKEVWEYSKEVEEVLPFIEFKKGKR